MGVDVTEEREQQAADTDKAAKGRDRGEAAPAAPAPMTGRFGQVLEMLRAGFRELEWRPILLYGIISGLLMSLSFIQGTALTIIAGIVPVGTGLLLGRKVHGHYGLHGTMTGLVGSVVGAISLASLIFLTPLGAAVQAGLGQGGSTFTLLGVWAQLAGFTALSLIAFVAFGTSMAGRTEQRNRAVREEIAARGGQLQRPGSVRGPDDVRGLSLPQFGSYVKNLFTKKGFQFKDYRFIDKDKHLDLWLEHEGEPWHLRLTVADKVNPGTVESLAQDMKREGCRKGVVLASTEFTPGAVKAAKGRPIVLIDGPTLYEIAEK
jgi:hypothetical protein